jgi:hypothetical protein
VIGTLALCASITGTQFWSAKRDLRNASVGLHCSFEAGVGCEVAQLEQENRQGMLASDTSVKMLSNINPFHGLENASTDASIDASIKKE